MKKRPVQEKQEEVERLNEAIQTLTTARLRPYLEKIKSVCKKNALGKLKEFSLEDLVGKTISSTLKVENPLQYNPRVTSPNPSYFDVLVFRDGSYLLSMEVGWQDGTTLHAFLVEKNRVKYKENPFSG